MKPPEVKTEGQRQLLAVEGTEAKLSARIGCSAAVVGHWRRGRRTPDEASRHKLELLFGIPRRAWDVAPGAEIPAVVAEGALEDDADTLAITKRQIVDVLAALKSDTLTDAASSKLRDTLAKLLALRARLERDQEMLEDRIVREHPEWTRVKAAILRALEPYPDAAAAVAEALES